MQGGNEFTATERAVYLIQKQVPDPDRQRVSEALLAVFAARHLGAEGVLALLRRLFMSAEILDQSPLYRRWIAEGKAEGEVKAMRQAALAALRGRWGELSADVEAAAAAGTKETLLDALAHVATDTPVQMRARLGL